MPKLRPNEMTPHQQVRDAMMRESPETTFDLGRNGTGDPEYQIPYQPNARQASDFNQGGMYQMQTGNPGSGQQMEAGQDQSRGLNGPIGVDQIRKAAETLRKYKKGKQNLESKIIRNEKWWKIRHWDMIEIPEMQDDPKPASAWLFNMITSKHADFMDSYPTSDILPREMGDVEEAKRLSSIIPVVMEQNDYKEVYSEEAYYKLKHGTGVYGVFWDQSKLNGLGDIQINCVDILTLFWEPGVTDIQKSQNLFSVELVDNDDLERRYPQVADRLKGRTDNIVKKYWYDESIDTNDKSAVVDWYYKKRVNGKETLQYCKFVDEVLLYATENDTEPPMQMDIYGNMIPSGPSMAERGLYDHGKYPFVFDVLFPDAGMPTGFGFIDVCKHPQTSIDIYNNCFEKNAQFVCSPRYLVRNDGGINEEEFADPNKLIVHVDSNLGNDSYIPINTPTFVTGNYMGLLEQKIQEMKETSGNRDAGNGGTQSGVTAASAIAAMQETAGKNSRDIITKTYEAHKKVVTMVIELIRQFYDMPRTFRITGEQGQQEFATYTNAGLQPQYQGNEFGVDMGYRLPVFDVDVKVEKDSPYSQLSQNELAIQFYGAGFFNPQQVDQALAAVEMMEFKGKEQVIEKIQRNAGLYQQNLQLQQQMIQMAEMIDRLTGGQTNLTQMTTQAANEQLDQEQGAPRGKVAAGQNQGKENPIVTRAREQNRASTSPR